MYMKWHAKARKNKHMLIYIIYADINQHTERGKIVSSL
jgi:hypothetical protein